MMQVKGSALVAMPVFIKEKHGDDGLNKWLNALSPEAKVVMGGKIMASSWYPLKQMLIDPMAKYCDLFYHGDGKGAWEMGRYSADVGLSGVYKIFVKAGSPDFIIKRAGSIMTGYYTPSEITIGESIPGKAVVRITKFPEPSAMVDSRIGGWMQRALEINGCKNVQVKVVKSLAKGGDCTEYLLTYT